MAKNDNIKKSMGQIKSPWLMNTLRSMGVASNEVIKELMPAISSTTKSTSQYASETIKNIKNNSNSSSVKNAIMNNAAIKMGQEYLKNAAEDIKSGNLYNTARADAAFDDMFDDSIFGDLDDMFDDDDSGNTNVFVSNQSANDEKTSASIDRQTEYQIKNTKATIDTMVSVSSINLVKMTELGDKILSSLSNIDSNIAALVEYQNTNMTKFIEASIGYYGQKEEDSSYKTKRLGMRDVISSEGGLDFGNYAKMIKQNIGDIKNDSLALTMMSMVLENKDMLISNPVGAILQGAIKATIPASVKASMEILDKSVKEAIPVFLEELSLLGEQSGSGISNEITKLIGKTFGVKVKSKKELDLGDTVDKGVMQYNGKANHTIVEIIPKYLRESNSYLREIAEKVTGKNNNDLLSNTTGYDWNSNTFKDISLIQKDLYDTILNDITNTFSMSDFGKEMSNMVFGQMVSDEDKENFSSALNQLYISIEKMDKKQNIGDIDTIDTLIGELGDYTDSIKTAIEKSLQTITADKSSPFMTNMKNTRIQATSRKNESMSRVVEDDNIHQATSFGNFENYANARYKGVNGGPGGGLNVLGVTAADQAEIQKQTGAVGSVVSTLHSIMNGDSQRISRDISNGLGAVLAKSANTLSEHFILPFKKTLFGEKNTDGYQEGGIFQGADNYLKESYFSFRKLMTGKGYTKADGSTVSDATEDEMKDTVLGRFKGMAVYFKDAVKEKLFGTDEFDEEGNKKEGVIGSFVTHFKDIGGTMTAGLIGWQQALFGGDEKSAEDVIADLKQKAKDTLPTALAGSIVGAGVGGLAGGSIIGTLVGGPIGGALLGFAGGVVSKSEKFQNWLFGEEKDGERVGGIISQKVQKYGKENGKLMLGGAAVGAVTGVIKGSLFGSGASGVLGTLVGGPLAGALMGIGSTMIFKSKMFNEFLFGNEEAGRKGIVTTIKNSFGKFGGGIKANLDKKTLGMGLVGGIGGAISGQALLSSGLLGLSLGPAGPIGGAIIGLGASIMAQQKGFKEWLFGTTDDEGNKKLGILGQAKNMIITKVLQPLTTEAKYVARDAKIFMEDQLAKIQMMAAPLIEMTGDFIKRTGEKIGAFASDIGQGIKDTFLNGLVPMMGEILSPLTKAVAEVGKGMYQFGKTIVGLPVNLLFTMTKIITHPITKAIKSTVGFIGGAINNVLIKPLKKIVIDPVFAVLKKTSEIVGNVVSAPFKLLGKGAKLFNDKVMGAAQHVERFFTRIRDDAAMWFKETVTEPIKAGIDAIKKTSKEWIHTWITPLLDLGKNAIGAIKDASLNTLKKFGSWAFDKTIGALGRGISSLWNKGKENKEWNSDERKRLKSGDREVRDEARAEISARTGKHVRRNMGDYLSDVWRGTKDGYMLTDFTGKDATFREAAERNRQDIINKKENNKRQREEDRKRNKNSNLIAKYTNNQQITDTKENRAIAEQMARKKGKKIEWADIDTIDAAQEKEAQEATIKTQEISNDIKNETEKTNTWLEKIFNAVEAYTPSTDKKKKNRYQNAQDRANAKKEEYTLQDKINTYDTAGKRAEDNINALDNAVDDKGNFDSKKAFKIHDEASKARNEEYSSYRDSYNLKDSLKAMFASYGKETSMKKSIFKNRKNIDEDVDNIEDVEAYAKGTSGARRGPAIVGERGPEAMYKPGSPYGKLVGMNGPEVVNMDGGETVIPNNKLPRYEDGTGSEINKSKLDNDKLLKESSPEKLTVFERILRELVSIKRNTDDDMSNNTAPKSIFSKVGSGIKNFGQNITGGISNIFKSDEELLAEREAEQASEMSEVTSLSYDNIVKNKDKTAKKPTIFDKINGGIHNLFEETKRHNSVFDFIFSEKGLITGLIVAGLPMISKILQSDAFKTLIDFGGKALVGIGDFIAEHGENIVNTIGTIAGKIGDFVSGIFDYFGEEDKITDKYGHEDGNSVSDNINNMGTILTNSADYLLKGDLYNTYKTFTSGANGEEVVYKDELDSAMLAVARHKSKGIINDSLTNKMNKELLGESTEKTTNKIVLEVMEKLTKEFSEEVVETISEKVGKKVASNTMPKILDNALSYLAKNLTKYAGKIITKLGIKITAATFTFLISEGIFAAIGLIEEVSNPRRLFYLPDNIEPDSLMYTISAVFGAILGTTAGAAIDLINEIWYAAFGNDFISAFATEVYGWFADGVSMDKLLADQQNMRVEYSAMADNVLRIDYQNLLNQGKLPAGTTFDEFITNNYYGNDVTLQSQKEYNESQNKGIFEKVGDWFGGLFTKNSDMIDAQTGKIYKNNNDGTFDVYDKDKNYLGTQTAESTEYTTAQTAGFMGDIQQFGDKYMEESMGTLGRIGENFGNWWDTVSGMWSGDFDITDPLKASGEMIYALNYALNPLLQQFDTLSNTVKEFNEANEGTDGLETVANEIGGYGSSNKLNGIPYYSQNDNRWASNNYDQTGNDTMSNAGCGPTSMAMVLSDITNKVIEPTTLASLAQSTGMRDETGTNSKFIDMVSNFYGINSDSKKNPTISDVISKLNSNNPVLLLGKDDGSNRTPYTKDGHYVVGTDIDSDGMVTYNDPISKERSGKKHIGDFINQTKSIWSFGGKRGKSITDGIGGYGTSKNPYSYYENGDGMYYNENDPSKLLNFTQIPEESNVAIIPVNGDPYYPYYDISNDKVSSRGEYESLKKHMESKMKREDGVIFTTGGLHLTGMQSNLEYITSIDQIKAIKDNVYTEHVKVANNVSGSMAALIAESQVGYLAKTTNNNLYATTANPGKDAYYTKYAKELTKTQTSNWGINFISWIMFKAAKDDKNMIKDILRVTTPSTIKILFDALNNEKRVLSAYDGKIGDIIFFRSTPAPTITTMSDIKIAIITQVNLGTNEYTYIYGNGLLRESTSSGTISASGVVKETTTIGSVSILAIGRPAYGVSTNSTKETEEILGNTVKNDIDGPTEGTEGLESDNTETTNTFVDTVTNTAKNAWDILSMLGDVVGKAFGAATNYVFGDRQPIDWKSVYSHDSDETSNNNQNTTYTPSASKKSLGKYANITDYILKNQPRGKYSITSNYGYRNYGDGWHDGIDFGESEYDETGDATYSPINGVIDEVRVNNKWTGNGVVVKDPFGYRHKFWHMHTPSHLGVGDSVSIGDDLGPVGSTGDSTGPHIHYEVRPPSGETMHPDEYPIEQFEEMHKQGSYSINATSTKHPTNTDDWSEYFNQPTQTSYNRQSRGTGDPLEHSIGGGPSQEIDPPISTSIKTKSISKSMSTLSSSSNKDIVEELLTQAVTLLTEISGKSDNLKLLKDLKNNQTSPIIVSNTNTTQTSNQGKSIVSKQNRKTTVGSDDARQIAFGY